MPLLDAVVAVSPAVRYVALLQHGHLESRQREGIASASANESDKYEEVIVNPTLITLLSQRGNIDCGGFRYVLIRYGSFVQYVQPLVAGHLAVSLEPTTDAAAVAGAIRALPLVAQALHPSAAGTAG